MMCLYDRNVRVSNQWCTQQERSQTGNTRSGAKHGKQMANNRALSVQCRVVRLEGKEKTVRMDDIRPSACITTKCHFFKRVENSLPLLTQIWSDST